jgi:molybdate transport system substrate-binding protein
MCSDWQFLQLLRFNRFEALQERHLKIRIRLGIAFVGIALACGLCVAQEVTVAAAADLQFAMQDVAAQFQRQTGKTVKVTYGSSGNFFQQIQNGAPFDMFFSANLDYPKKLESAGLVESGSYYPYAKGKIVVWVLNESKIKIDSGLKVFLDPDVKKIAIANPQHAPYGQAAVAALQKEGIYDKVKDKFVLGENISQTASFVVSGAADAGVVALSLALSPNMKSKGRYAEIPANEYPPIEQACVILNSSKNKETARQFLAFVQSEKVAAILSGYGFDVHDRPAK